MIEKVIIDYNEYIKLEKAEKLRVKFRDAINSLIKENKIFTIQYYYEAGHFVKSEFIYLNNEDLADRINKSNNLVTSLRRDNISLINEIESLKARKWYQLLWRNKNER